MLSSNILKQQDVPQLDKKIAIKTRQLVSHANNTPTDPQLVALDRKLARQTADYQQKLKQLKEEMLATAEQEAEKLKQTAYETGLQAGKTAGYAAAKKEGQEQMAVLVQQAKENVWHSVTEAEHYSQEKQTEFSQFAVKLAEVLLKTQLELQPEKITTLLAPLLFELEQPDQVILVWAHSQYHAALTQKLTQIKQEVPDFRFIIFDDDSLANLQLKVESNEKVIQIDLHRELQKFLQEL